MSLVFAVACAALSLGVSDAETSDSAKPAAFEIIAIGNLVCAHCEAGVGETCKTGVRVGTQVLAIEGKHADKLFDERRSERRLLLIGPARTEGGHFFIAAKTARDPDSDQPRQYLAVRGKLEKGEEGFSVGGDKGARIVGADDDRLEPLLGKSVEVEGAFALIEGTILIHPIEIKHAKRLSEDDGK